MKASQAFQEQPTEMEALWNSCSGPIYSLEDKQKQLGLGDKVGLRFTSLFWNCCQIRWLCCFSAWIFLQGITTYFSGNCCLEDAELAQKFLDSKVNSALPYLLIHFSTFLNWGHILTNYSIYMGF